MILIISTTNRKGAKSLMMAQYYLELLQLRGATAEILTLEDLPLDFAFSALYENSGKEPQFNAAIDRVAVAEKFVFIVPEYNGSMPGVLKTFIDGLGWPNALAGKKAALAGLSDGVLGAALGLSHLTDVLHFLTCHVYGVLVRVNHMKKNYLEGEIQDPFIRGLVQKQVDGFLDW